MTYALIAAILLVVSAVGAFLLLRRRPASHTWPAIGVTVLVLVALTAVFDNVMIGAGLFYYDDSLTTGIRLGLAPIEDFSYPVACGLALPALWIWLTRRQKGRTQREDPE